MNRRALRHALAAFIAIFLALCAFPLAANAADIPDAQAPGSAVSTEVATPSDKATANQRAEDAAAENPALQSAIDALEQTCKPLFATVDATEKLTEDHAAELKEEAEQAAKDAQAAANKKAAAAASEAGSSGQAAGNGSSGNAAAAAPAAEPAAAEAPEAAAEPVAAPAPKQDNVWHVSYYNDYGAPEAAADGSVTQWADGYFIAHNWSAGGAKIAAHTPLVEVNGRTYRYVSSKVYPEGTYYEDGPDAFVHAGGGIGFQTCVSGGYLVCRYDPA